MCQWSMDTTITPFGIIVEEPETYGNASSELSGTTRLRRATSWASLDRGMSTMMSAGSRGPSIPWEEYRRKSYSTTSVPARKPEYVHRFSTLSDPFPVFIDETAPPVHEDVPMPEKSEGRRAMVDGFDGLACTGVIPTDVMKKRYRRTYFIPKEYEATSPTIQPLQTTFCLPSIDPSNIDDCELNWEPCKSPEGNLYFREAGKRVFTCVDLYNDDYREAVAKCALYLLRRLEEESNEAQKGPVPEDTEVVILLEEYDDGGGYGFGYYMASWARRCVFWLEEMEYDLVTEGTRVCMTESHVGQQIELLFWTHVEMFPCDRSIPEDMVDDLRDILNLGVYDHISSSNSIFPYDRTEAADILRCLDRVKPFRRNDADTWVVARCKQNLVNFGFLNYHGERGARIHRNDSVKQDTIHGKRSLLFKLVTPFLFWMPSVYMKEIETVWIDESVDWISWRKFATLIYKDWNQSMTPATVILSANVGFLAINSIDTGNEDRTAAQIASYISSVLSFFFFITVQVLTHQHRSSEYFTPSIALSFLERRSQNWLGLESVALTFSLPTALFIWSMLTFLTALMIVFFWHTSIVTRVLMGTVTVILLAVTAILLCLDWNNHSANEDGHAGRQGSIVYALCPSGLRHTLLNVREKWQHKGRVIFRRKSSNSSMASIDTGSRASTATMVGSP